MTAKKSKAKQPAKLFPQEAKLLKRIGAAPDRRASVAQIGVVVFPPKTLAKLRKDPRKMHQRVGTIVFRINKKRRSFNIAPDPDRAGVYVLRAHHS